MTAVAATGTVDCSGYVASILRGYRAVGARVAEEVRGEPATVRAAAEQQAAQARQLTQVSQQARQRTTALAANWEGGAYEAYAARSTGVAEKLEETSQKLSLQSRKLELAASALEAAAHAMTAALADFDGKANQLIALAHTAAPGAVNAFLSSARTLGQSLVDVSTTVRDDLSRSLDVIAGNDPTKPESGTLASKTKYDAELKKWLGQQPWFRKWYADHGWGDDPTKPKFGALDELGNTDLLDELMGKKAEPTTALGRLAERTSGTFWKTEGDGPLWQWGVGDKVEGRTDLPGGGAAGGSLSGYLGPQVTADAKVGFEGENLTVEGNAKVTLADVKGDAYVTYGPATTQASGEAYVGAAADANAKLGLDGASVHAGAFAGAKAEGSVAADVGGIGAGLTASARAGVGAELDAKATWENGHIQLGFQASAALGVGAGVGGSIDIDVGKVWHSYESLDPVGAQALRDGATWVGNTATQASHAVGEALDYLEGK